MIANLTVAFLAFACVLLGGILGAIVDLQREIRKGRLR